MTIFPRTSLRILSLFALAVAMVCSPPLHAREWLRAELPGVVLYSDGYPHELQRWALKVRLFDALLRHRFGVSAQDTEPGSPLTIYLLNDDGDIERLTGRENLVGFYSPSIEGSYLIASRAAGYDKFRLSGQMSLFHEYTHHFMYRHFASAWPAWYREGLADYTGAVTFDADRTAQLGFPSWPRMKHLDGKPMPLATVLTASVDDFKPDEKARFYAWSWKLVHLLSRSPDDRQRLDHYLARYAAGQDSLSAAGAAFGDLATLELRLHSHLPDPRSGEAVPVSLGLVPDLVVSALDPLASRLIDLRLARMVGRDPKTSLADLNAFVGANPYNAEGRHELALALKGSNLSAALTEAQTAVSLAPDDHRTLAVWADIAIRHIKSNPATTATDWNTLRSRLENAISAGSRDPMVLSMLFRSYLSEPRRPSPQALGAMERALALQPESYEMRFLGVYAQAMSGKSAQARRTAMALASDPHAGLLGKQALAMLDRMKPGPIPNCGHNLSGDDPC